VVAVGHDSCMKHKIYTEYIKYQRQCDNMDNDIETTTNYTAPLTEIHWIESESLFASTDPATDPRLGNDHPKDDDTHDGNDDLGLDDLFIDPDPYETFTLQWKILNRHVGEMRTTGSNSCVDSQDEYSNGNYHDRLATNTTTATTDAAKTDHNKDGFIETTAQITVVGNKAENGQTLHSTGLTLWRASQLLTDYLVAVHNHQSQCVSTELSIPNNQDNNCNHSECTVKNETIAVLELGCGLGIPSMLYHYYLRSSLLLSSSSSSSSSSCTKATTNTITIATDADIDTLHNLRQNFRRVQQEQVELSDSSPFDHTNTNEATHNVLTCQQLIWGNAMHIQSVLQTLQLHCHRIETHTAATLGSGDEPSMALPTNASAPSTPKKFDILLGSDIIYVEHVVEPLFHTVVQLLSPHGVFLLAFARRNVSIDYVLSVAQQQGLVYEYKELTAAVDSSNKSTLSPSSSMEGVYVFRLRPEQ
jgi:predicted nicotinamide N-methyase